MHNNDKIYTKMPDHISQSVRQFFHQAIPLKTLVITCPDPRASSAAEAVAREFGKTPWLGEIIRDANGVNAGSTTEVAIQVTTGGRSADAERTVPWRRCHER